MIEDVKDYEIRKMLEHEAIVTMLKRSSEAGMLIEVIKWYGDRMARGDDVVESARCALYEWDC